MRALPWRNVVAGVLAIVVGGLSGLVLSTSGFGWLMAWLLFVGICPILLSLIATRRRWAFGLVANLTMWLTWATTAYLNLRKDNLLMGFYEVLPSMVVLMFVGSGVAIGIGWAVDRADQVDGPGRGRGVS